MKVLVTGATGFIGNYVVNELLKTNHSIIATSRDIKKAKQLSWFNKVDYVPYDLNDRKDDLYQYFGKPDATIHLAWEGLPNYKNVAHMEKYLFNNYHFIKNMVMDGLKDLTITGTCFEYGLQEGCLDEDMPTDPVTAYGLAKDTLRKFLVEINKEHKFNLKWIRLFYMYGEGQNPNSLLCQLDKALDESAGEFDMSPGNQLRDYLPIERVAEYIVKIAMQNKVLGMINCCSGKPISIKTLVENYIKKKGKMIKLNLGHYPYNNYEPMAFWGDNSKLLRIIK